MIKITKSYDLMKEALDYRAMRQDMIASNIANADTPFYRPKDIRFEDKLIQEKEKAFNKPSNQLQMAKTSSNHLNPIEDNSNLNAKVFFRDGHMARNDGNSVDLDVETSEMAKNSVMYNGLVNGIKKQASIFRAVIEYSGKLS
jgi:flagellar basal-body rod protein FlgB